MQWDEIPTQPNLSAIMRDICADVEKAKIIELSTLWMVSNKSILLIPKDIDLDRLVGRVPASKEYRANKEMIGNAVTYFKRILIENLIVSENEASWCVYGISIRLPRIPTDEEISIAFHNAFHMHPVCQYLVDLYKKYFSPNALELIGYSEFAKHLDFPITSIANWIKSIGFIYIDNRESISGPHHFSLGVMNPEFIVVYFNGNYKKPVVTTESDFMEVYEMGVPEQVQDVRNLAIHER